MDAFIQTLGGVSALVLGIIALAIFFTILGYLKRWIDRGKTIDFPGITDKTKTTALFKIKLVGGEVLDSVKIIGFTRQDHVKSGVPFNFSKMLILDLNGHKIYLKPDMIQMIQEVSING
jgi:hypothetical protein